MTFCFGLGIASVSFCVGVAFGGWFVISIFSKPTKHE